MSSPSNLKISSPRSAKTPSLPGSPNEIELSFFPLTITPPTSPNYNSLISPKENIKYFSPDKSQMYSNFQELTNDFIKAVFTNNLKQVQMLALKVKDLSSIIDPDGFGLLHLAVPLGNLNMVKYLLDCGLDVNSIHESRMFKVTPLSCAFENNHIEIAELLIERGADVTVITDCFDKSSILQECIRRNMNTLIKPIINAAFNKCETERLKFINHQNKSLDTALHLAIKNYDLNTIKILMDAGADANILGKNNKSAMQLARKNSNSDILTILSEKK